MQKANHGPERSLYSQYRLSWGKTGCHALLAQGFSPFDSRQDVVQGVDSPLLHFSNAIKEAIDIPLHLIRSLLCSALSISMLCPLSDSVNSLKSTASNLFMGIWSMCSELLKAVLAIAIFSTRSIATAVSMGTAVGGAVINGAAGVGGAFVSGASAVYATGAGFFSQGTMVGSVDLRGNEAPFSAKV